VPATWQPYAAEPDARAPIPGDVVRKVGGYSVHRIDGVDYLSTSTVLNLMRWGDLSHVDPHALAYGTARGTNVDRACRWLEEGDLDWASLGPQQAGYVLAWAKFLQREPWQTTAIEPMVINADCRTFGYLDRVGLYQDMPAILDLKSSDMLGASVELQMASYVRGGERIATVHLHRDGTYDLQWRGAACWRERFAQLAREAHMWIAEQDARATAQAEKDRHRWRAWQPAGRPTEEMHGVVRLAYTTERRTCGHCAAQQTRIAPTTER
jgi:hypothetical protein